MRILWTRRALRTLDEIAEYISRERPTAASRQVRRIREAVLHLAQHPRIGRPGRVVGTRELVVSGTPFIVPYRLRNGEVEILTVLHGARRWPEDFT